MYSFLYGGGRCFSFIIILYRIDKIAWPCTCVRAVFFGDRLFLGSGPACFLAGLRLVCLQTLNLVQLDLVLHLVTKTQPYPEKRESIPPGHHFFRLIRFVRIIRFVRFSFPSSDGPGGDRALRPLPGDRFAPRLHGAVRLHLRIPDLILPLHDLILLRVIP